MENDLIYLLSRGPKSEVELAAFFGVEHLSQVMAMIEELNSLGCIQISNRQGRVANGEISLATEYRLLVDAVSAA